MVPLAGFDEQNPHDGDQLGGLHPSASFAGDLEKQWGNNTFSSISNGVIQGTISEIEGQIIRYRKLFTPLTIILTGGDAQYLSKNIKNTIFAELNFLAEGLDYLLEFNRK